MNIVRHARASNPCEFRGIQALPLAFSLVFVFVCGVFADVGLLRVVLALGWIGLVRGLVFVVGTATGLGVLIG